MKTKAQIVAELARGFEQHGYKVERGPFEIRNDQGEVTLIADRRIVYTGQMRLPLAEGEEKTP